MSLLKLLFLIPVCIAGYIGGSIAAAVEGSDFAFYVGFVFGAIVTAFTLGVIFDSDAPTDDRPLFRRLAPLAFLYWLTKDKH